MLGRMLLGVWLLLHHECCALGGEEGRLRNPMLVDSLTRRSSLEKNFMRFGRSSHFEVPTHHLNIGLAEDEEAMSEKRTRNPLVSSSKSNFMRLGRSNDNFMRLGRSNDNFMQLGRSNDNFMRLGRSKDNFMRFGRGGENFMRFGRGKGNLPRLGRADRVIEDGFIRFGRSLPSPLRPGFILGPELTLLPPLALKQRNDNSPDIIRLG